MPRKIKFYDRFKSSLLDHDKYIRLVRLIAYVVLFGVAIFMTVLNIVSSKDNTQPHTLVLTYTTGIFSILLIPNFFLTYFSKIGRKIAAWLFFFEFIAMFSVFLWSGEPEGFSAIWIALVPIACMIFYGRKIGSLVSAVMFVILAVAFYLPRFVPSFPSMIGMYENYTTTFQIRFPILYVAFYLIALFLETIQQYQFKALEEVNTLNEGYSTHDGLTGLFNRKGFYDLLESELKTRTYSKIGFIIFDLDYFKKLNDTYGHLAGDEVLIELANIIKDKLGNSLAQCRWGGEEFLVCYVDEQIKKADLEEFRKTVESHDFIFNEYTLKTTISGGVFETNDKVFANKDEWLKNADSALYNAKETGRNKVVYF